MLLVIVQLATTASTFVMLELHYIMKDSSQTFKKMVQKISATELYEKWGME